MICTTNIEAACQGDEAAHGENLAAWRGNLKHLFASPRKKAPPIPMPSLQWREVPKVMMALRTGSSISARALEFLILTESRSGEVRGARSNEINRGTKVWTVPAERMKNRREHRVPLSDAALAVLDAMLPFKRGNDSLNSANARFGSQTLVRTAQKAGAGETVVHGFRSTFRIWAEEVATSYPRPAVEMALAHTVGSAVERAHQRSDLLDQRRGLMADWPDWCGSAHASKETKAA